MVLIVYGFPSSIQALQFEWSWQNPEKSLDIRAVASKLGRKARYGVQGKIRLLMEMLRAEPWCYFPLTVQFLSSRVSAERGRCPAPPPHMPVLVAPLEDLPETLSGGEESAEEEGGDSAAEDPLEEGVEGPWQGGDLQDGTELGAARGSNDCGGDSFDGGTEDEGLSNREGGQGRQCDPGSLEGFAEVALAGDLGLAARLQGRLGAAWLAPEHGAPPGADAAGTACTAAQRGPIGGEVPGAGPQRGEAGRAFGIGGAGKDSKGGAKPKGGARAAAAAAARTASSCAVCSRAANRTWAVCPSCGKRSHVECLARALLEGGHGESSLPDRGRCPSCSTQLVWREVLGSLQNAGWDTRGKKAKAGTLPGTSETMAGDEGGSGSSPKRGVRGRRRAAAQRAGAGDGGGVGDEGSGGVTGQEGGGKSGRVRGRRKTAASAGLQGDLLAARPDGPDEAMLRRGVDEVGPEQPAAAAGAVKRRGRPRKAIFPMTLQESMASGTALDSTPSAAAASTWAEPPAVPQPSGLLRCGPQGGEWGPPPPHQGQTTRPAAAAPLAAAIQEASGVAVQWQQQQQRRPYGVGAPSGRSMAGAWRMDSSPEGSGTLPSGTGGMPGVEQRGASACCLAGGELEAPPWDDYDEWGAGTAGSGWGAVGPSDKRGVSGGSLGELAMSAAPPLAACLGQADESVARGGACRAGAASQQLPQLPWSSSEAGSVEVVVVSSGSEDEAGGLMEGSQGVLKEDARLRLPLAERLLWHRQQQRGPECSRLGSGSDDGGLEPDISRSPPHAVTSSLPAAHHPPRGTPSPARSSTISPSPTPSQITAASPRLLPAGWDTPPTRRLSSFRLASPASDSPSARPSPATSAQPAAGSCSEAGALEGAGPMQLEDSMQQGQRAQQPGPEVIELLSPSPPPLPWGRLHAASQLPGGFRHPQGPVAGAPRLVVPSVHSGATSSLGNGPACAAGAGGEPGGAAVVAELTAVCKGGSPEDGLAREGRPRAFSRRRPQHSPPGSLSSTAAPAAPPPAHPSRAPGTARTAPLLPPSPRGTPSPAPLRKRHQCLRPPGSPPLHQPAPPVTGATRSGQAQDSASLGQGEGRGWREGLEHGGTAAGQRAQQAQHDQWRGERGEGRGSAGAGSEFVEGGGLQGLVLRVMATVAAAAAVGRVM